MCGISGLVGSSNRVYARSCVRKMNVALARRGPDAEGIDSWDRATLGHRRLDVMHRRLMNLPHSFVQIAAQAGHGLRTDRLTGQDSHQPPHLPGRDPLQKRLPDQQRDFFGPALKLLQHRGQKTPLAGAGDAQTQAPEAGHEITFVVAVAIIPPRFLPAVPRASHVQVALSLGKQLEQPPHALLHLPLQVAHEMLELLGDGCYLRHGCKSPCENGFSFSGQTYTLSSFTQSKLRQTQSRLILNLLWLYRSKPLK